MSKAKQTVVIGCLLLIWTICVGVMISPVIKNPWLLRLVTWSLLLSLIGSLVLGGSAIWKKPHPLNWLVALLAALAAPFVLFSHAFGDFSMFAFLFHLEFGAGGATLEGLGDSIGTAVLATTFFVLSVYWFHNFVAPTRVFWPVVLAVIILVNPASQFFLSFMASAATEDLLVRELRTPEMLDTADRPDVPDVPDVIVIYLEGIERGFADTSRFGDVYQPMTDLGPQSISFTNVLESEGTDWSIAGLAATLCGLPLVPNGLSYGNKFREQSIFLGGHVCLSDVFKDRGYALRFLKGTDKSFAGFDHFLGTHGFDDVIDRQAQFAMYPEEEREAASAGWTIDDQMLFETSRAEYSALVASDQPIAMFIETIGPHGTVSVLSRECSDGIQAKNTGDVAASVACTVDAVAAFMAFVDETRNGRPTAFIIMSDHLNHAPKIADALADTVRSNTILFHGLDFMGAAGVAGEQISKPATMVDVYPSILAWLGFASPEARGGLGVSLFSGAPTLLEQLGMETLNSQLIPNPDLSAAIWDGSKP